MLDMHVLLSQTLERVVRTFFPHAEILPSILDLHLKAHVSLSEVDFSSGSLTEIEQQLRSLEENSVREIYRNTSKIVSDFVLARTGKSAAMHAEEYRKRIRKHMLSGSDKQGFYYKVRWANSLYCGLVTPGDYESVMPNPFERISVILFPDGLSVDSEMSIL